MMFLLNLFKNLVMKMLIKEIGNPLDFLTTPKKEFATYCGFTIQGPVLSNFRGTGI